MSSFGVLRWTELRCRKHCRVVTMLERWSFLFRDGRSQSRDSQKDPRSRGGKPLSQIQVIQKYRRHGGERFKAGNQPILDRPPSYGVSVTDAGIDGAALAVDA